MEYRYEAAGELQVVRVEAAGEGYAVTVDGQTYVVKAVERVAGDLIVELEGAGRQRFVVATAGSQRWVALPGAAEVGPFVLTVPTTVARRRAGASGHEALVAQMPGVVRQVLAAEGEAVERGQVLLLLEAMKMEIKITAPHAGRVRAVAVTAGQAVDRGQMLVDLAA